MLLVYNKTQKNRPFRCSFPNTTVTSHPRRTPHRKSTTRYTSYRPKNWNNAVSVRQCSNVCLSFTYWYICNSNVVPVIAERDPPSSPTIIEELIEANADVWELYLNNQFCAVGYRASAAEFDSTYRDFAKVYSTSVHMISHSNPRKTCSNAISTWSNTPASPPSAGYKTQLPTLKLA